MKRFQRAIFLSPLVVGLLGMIFFVLSIFRSDGQVRADYFAYYQYRQAGNTTKAIQVIDAMLHKDPNNPVLYAEKAFTLLMPDTCLQSAVGCFANRCFQTQVPERDRREALGLFREASRNSPADPVFLNNIGWLNLTMGDTLEAIHYLECAVALAPFNSVGLVSCGLLAEQTVDSIKATSYYARALSINPSLWDTPFFRWLRRHRVQQSNEILIDAARLVENERVQEPENGIILSRLAKLRYAQGDMVAAWTLLQNAVSKLPNLNRSWLLLGQIEEQRAHPTVAEMCYKKAMFLDRYDPLPPLFLAKLADSRKDTMEVDRLYRVVNKNVQLYRTMYSQISAQIYGLRMWNNEYYPSWLLPWLTVHAEFTVL